MNAIEQADIARAIQHDTPTTGTREEFPIVDSEAIILVTPGEPHAQIINEGFPADIDIAAIPTAGGYIFVPADQDAADSLGTILGYPIAPDDRIRTGIVYNENSVDSEGRERREQRGGDITFETEEAARREAIRRWGGQVSEPNNFEREDNWDSNPNLRGPNGEPSEILHITDLNGNPVTIKHHKWGHTYPDNTYEYPHYHGPNGEHISYRPG